MILYRHLTSEEVLQEGRPFPGCLQCISLQLNVGNFDMPPKLLLLLALLMGLVNFFDFLKKIKLCLALTNCNLKVLF